MASIISGFQGIKFCVKYLAINPHKPILYPFNSYMDQMSSDLHGVGIKLNTTQPRFFLNAINMRIMQESSTERGQFKVFLIILLVLLPSGKYIFDQL